MLSSNTMRGLAGLIAATALSYTASAGCNGPVCYSGPAAHMQPSMSQMSSSMSAPMSAPSLPGLGMNESLSPTSCPVSVHNPGGGQVLGCYNVVKPAPMPAPVMHQPIVTPITTYNQVRVVRPIIHVPYPVPTPVFVQQPMPMPSCGMPMPRPVCY